jgi:serine phosphatase RsbU (regulator of sigma subunit)
VPLAIDLGIAKINKYASRESGDTAEVIERPGGGISVVVVDGQGSGFGAKALSLLLTGKAVSLLKEGVRDGAVARAVHDTLLAYRGGRVSASLDIVSVDLKHGNLILTRNGTSPVIVCSDGIVRILAADEGPIGIYPFTRPGVERLPLKVGLQVYVVTDGVVTAGRRSGTPPFDLARAAEGLIKSDLDAREQARQLLQVAIDLDKGRPADDMSVMTLRVVDLSLDGGMRTLHMHMPAVWVEPSLERFRESEID